MVYIFSSHRSGTVQLVFQRYQAGTAVGQEQNSAQNLNTIAHIALLAVAYAAVVTKSKAL